NYPQAYRRESPAPKPTYRHGARSAQGLNGGDVAKIIVGKRCKKNIGKREKSKSPPILKNITQFVFLEQILPIRNNIYHVLNSNTLAFNQKSK
ncbi:MAG TPA: hypothetical protein PKX83_08970, partial [Bacteroidales bacterium]|nr:hypothetical protein [Bacteroidales bacterium]